jgi:Asp-tRNA(Asn)/Glu-tRNA(Gln) amidotransferase A subunit family amidase
MLRHRSFNFVGGCLLAVATAATPVASALAQRAPGRGATAPPATTFDVMEKTILELQEAMTRGQVTSKELVSAYLARIAAYERSGPALNAFITVDARALETAEALDRERASKGPRGPLHGIPIVVKDNFETADMPTTGGSIALAGFMPGHDAFQVQKLRDAGVVIIGKTNLHELAAGITSISSLGGQTRNPYEPTRNPGGSSGGTGAAVAANFAVAGMGSDTCGSIRIPAASNNLVGLRGTLGLSSRRGIIPLSHTQDIGGPLARSVTDLAIMLDATVGLDEGDSTTSAGKGHVPQSYRDALQVTALKDVHVGVLKNLFGAAQEDNEVNTIDRKALDAMKAAGAQIEEVTIPGLEDLVRGSSVINSEFKFDLMDYLAPFPNAAVHSLGDILDRGEYDKALENTFTLRNKAESRETEEYRRARVKRAAVRDLVLATMEELKLDVLAYPPLGRKAAIIGEPQGGGANCQLSASSGLPAISMPAGFTDDGVPVGVELLGRAWTEPRLLAIAYAYEQATHLRRPPSTTPPLVGGKAPAPRTFVIATGSVRTTFTFDVTTRRLKYDVLTMAGADAAIAAAIHRATDAANGPVVVRLLDGMGRPRSGDAILGGVDTSALQSGKLYIEVTTKGGTNTRSRIEPGAQSPPPPLN